MVVTWGLLKHYELPSESDTLASGTFTAKQNLKVTIFSKNTGTVTSNLTFNGDTGTNYTSNYADNGSATTSATGLASMPVGSEATDSYQTYEILNVLNKYKLVYMNKVTGGTQTGAGYAPDRRQAAFTWSPNAQVVSITLTNTGSSAGFMEGSFTTVWGSSFDPADLSKASITNVPVGTRYEETDTKKIFRRTSSAWVEKGTA